MVAGTQALGVSFAVSQIPEQEAGSEDEAGIGPRHCLVGTGILNGAFPAAPQLLPPFCTNSVNIPALSVT